MRTVQGLIQWCILEEQGAALGRPGPLERAVGQRLRKHDRTACIGRHGARERVRELAPLRSREAAPLGRHVEIRLVRALDAREASTARRYGHELQCHRDQPGAPRLVVVHVVRPEAALVAVQAARSDAVAMLQQVELQIHRSCAVVSCP